MEKKGWIVFDDDDESYLRWVDLHPAGYVLNMRREKNPAYRVLHRAGCPSITEYTGQQTEGAFTRHLYIKVCAEDIESLKEWSRTERSPDGSFSGSHAQCKPF